MANDLVVSVGGNIRDLERAMKAASEQAEKRANEIEDKFDKINPGKLLGAEALAGLIKGAAAGFAIDKITDAFFSATREVAAFGETARRAGLDLQQFQELRLAGMTKGIDAEAFDSGLDGLAKLLNEARREENGLTELLGANNIKFKERNGEVISTNKALAIAADLINRAATEMDKLEIAEKFGLSKDFVPLLEGGANALAQLRRNAEESGNVLSKEVIDKARAFDDAWREAWATWTTYGKSALVTVGTMIADLIGKAQALLALPGQVTAGIGAAASGAYAVPKTTEDLADLEQQAKDVQKQIEGITSRLHPSRARESNTDVERLKGELQDLQNRIDLGKAAVPKAIPNATQPPERPAGIGAPPSREDATKLPDKKKSGGGGGSSGKSDAESAQDRLDRYTESLRRQNSVLDAEIATFGKSNAERRAAVELAKAQVDLAKLDETSRQSVIAGLTKEIQLSEQKRTVLEDLKKAQKGLQDAQKFFGDAAVDALEDLIINGAKAEDVMKRLAASLAKAALQAALMGSGPLAGIFGTSGTGGNVGGLFGMLFGGIGKNANGGWINGPGSGRSDSILSWVSNGEHITNARSAKKYAPLLDAINSDRLPRFASGGFVGPNLSTPKVRAIAPRSAGAGGVTVNVQNNTPAQVETKPRADGGVDMIIRQVEGALAQRFVHGQGSLSQAFGARNTNRHLRG